MGKNIKLIVYVLLLLLSFNLFGARATVTGDSSNSELWNGYFDIESSLTKDDLQDAFKSAKSLMNTASNIKLDSTLQKDINRTLDKIVKSKDISMARANFYELTKIFDNEKVKTLENKSLYEFYCPMALDNEGAEWFQNTKVTKNPYLGESMLTCGELKNTYNTK